MSGRTVAVLVALAAVLSACGGGGGASGPTSVASTFSLSGAVFYDENGNGVLDPAENTRLGDVEVDVAGRSGRTSKVVGEFTVQGVAGGAQAVTLRRGSLPPYFVPPTSVSVSLPQSQPLMIPVTLPIGNNRPNVYMGFGDSTTIGQGSSDNLGYRGRLQDKLIAQFGRATIVNEGADATRSNKGADRIDDSLARQRPAYTLILYGTNDWNVAACKNTPPCFTIDSLRDIALSAKGSGSLPILSTIIPGDPTSNDQPDRNKWVSDMDVRIRALGKELNVPVADPEPLFLKSPNFSTMYVDHVHPNDSGYELIAQAFYAAIATPADSSSSGFVPALLTGPAAPAPVRAAARPAVGRGSRP